MNPPPQITAFSLQDIAGDCLLQESPYPVVAPRSVETLSMVVQYARIEGLKVMVLGTGSSFADNFRLSSTRVIAAMTYRLKGLQQITPYVTRILSGTPVSRLFAGDVGTERKTLGGLVAAGQAGRDAAAHAVLSKLLAVEILNAEAKLVRLAAGNTGHAGDPGVAGAVFGSRGRMGIITAFEVMRSVPWTVAAGDDKEVFVPSLASHDSAVKRADTVRLFDPDGLFAWQ